jgi:hypothetical protein
MRLCILLVFIVLNTIRAAKPCIRTSDGTPSDNFCVDEKDEDGHPTPNCMNIGSQATPDWRCARCAVNCDCPPGSFCVKTPGPQAGTCRTLSSTGRIGATCTSFGLMGTPTARIPVAGLDEETICGEAFFDEATGSFVSFEWMGDCAVGRCYECGGGAAAWSMAYTIELVSQTADQSNASVGSPWDSGSLVCGDGRTCYHGEIVGSASWIWEYLPTGLLIAILVILLFIFIIVVVGAIAECYARWHDGRLPALLQRAAARPSAMRRGSHVQQCDLTEAKTRFIIGEDSDDVPIPDALTSKEH